MEATLTVRAASAEDAAQIAAVHRDSAGAAYRDIFPSGALFRGPGVDGWRARVSDATAVALVALLGSEVVGFVTAGPNRDSDPGPTVGEVYALYVVPPAWRRGVGSLLLDEAGRRLRVRGYVGATLWVLDGNAVGRRFYEKHGWVPDGTAEPREDGVVELRYRVAL